MTTDSVPIRATSLPEHAPSAGYLVGLGRVDRRRHRVKRLLDLGLILLFAFIVIPLGLLIALGIRLTSPGPVLFRQQRMGARLTTRKGRPCWQLRPFRIYKFRSMVADADPAAHIAHIRAFASDALPGSTTSGADFKIRNDPRITPIGRLLRRTSLDELPQLINVLRGEMSLVGPRPVPIYEFEEYQPAHVERLAALPGLTGLWQVEGRGRVTFDEMMAMDIDYVRRQSLQLDIALLLRTIPAVMMARGAR